MANEVLPPQVGTKLKIGFTAEIEGEDLTLEDIDFECEIYSRIGKSVKLKKSELVRLDESNYVAAVDSNEVGRGDYMMVLHLYVPDGDFDEGIRDEVVKIPTGIKVV